MMSRRTSLRGPGKGTITKRGTSTLTQLNGKPEGKEKGVGSKKKNNVHHLEGKIWRVPQGMLKEGTEGVQGRENHSSNKEPPLAKKIGGKRTTKYEGGKRNRSIKRTQAKKEPLPGGTSACRKKKGLARNTPANKSIQNARLELKGGG